MSYGDGPGWRDAAARSLDKMHDRATKAEAEVESLRQRCAEADRLLRVAYADAHPEDVPVDVLVWLNPA